jgi:hypothetical protein
MNRMNRRTNVKSSLNEKSKILKIKLKLNIKNKLINDSTNIFLIK